MNIDFSKIEEARMDHFKGGEGALLARMFFDGTNRIMKARLEPGSSIGLHEHDTSCEVMFITEGRGTVIIDGEKMTVKAGDVHYCPKGHSHTLINDSDAILAFNAVVPAQ